MPRLKGNIVTNRVQTCVSMLRYRQWSFKPNEVKTRLVSFCTETITCLTVSCTMFNKSLNSQLNVLKLLV
jgi:hypothetical protein